MAVIDMHLVTSCDCIKYTELFVNSCILLASQKHDIKLYLYGIGNINSNSIKKTNQIVKIFNKKDLGHSSPAHGTCLHYMHEFIKSKSDSDYSIIADSDMVITMKNWDEICISLLKSDEKAVVVGVEYPEVGDRYSHFPGIFFSMFKSDFLRNNDINWMPEYDERTKKLKRSRDNSEIIRRDTAWTLKSNILKKGYKGIKIDHVFVDDQKAILPKDSCLELSFNMLPNNLHYSYEYHLNNELFASHLVLSRHRRFNAHPLSICWIKRVSAYLHRRYDIKTELF